MTEDIQIKGSAGEFEAAVIAVVLDQIVRDEKAAAQGLSDSGPGVAAWVRALFPEEPNVPREVVWPDG